MGNSCTCFNTSSYLDTKTFLSLNQYVSRTKQNDAHVNKILSEIAPGSINIHHLNVAAYVAELEGRTFIDKNFQSMENGSNLEVSPLSKMYNFSKFGLERVFKKNYNTSMSIFDQKQVELCYLNCIFYLICCSNELKKQIFITQEVNKHKVYIINLFCEGHLTNVVVDQNVPTMHQNIKFLSVRTPGQLWPFLLEKAWCKQIGGYNKARGLSPEDCFQQITGIPASSVQLKKFRDKDIWEMLCKSYNDSYWISLTAKQNEQQYGIKSRQVFYLESLNETRNSIILRSPFIKFEYHSKKSDAGEIQLKMEQIMLNFDFATIGAYTEGFVPSSLQFTSEKNEELIFEITLSTKTKFNLRVIQFYQEYLSEIDKEMYQYSSVLIELYDRKKNLVENSAGSLGNYSKTRSTRKFTFDHRNFR